MRTRYLANKSLVYCRYNYFLINMIQGHETNWSRRLPTECSSTAQQVRPTKTQTTNLYIPAPPFGCGFKARHVVLTTVLWNFTAAGRHDGDLTAVIQALLSLCTCSFRLQIRTATSLQVPSCADSSHLFMSLNTGFKSCGLHIDLQYNVWTRSLPLPCHVFIKLRCKKKKTSTFTLQNTT